MMNTTVKNNIWLSLLCLCCILAASCHNDDINGNSKNIQSLKQLEGAVIGVQLGSTSDVLATQLEQKGKGTKVERFTKSSDAVQALLQNKIDCIVEDELPARAFLRNNPSLSLLPEEFGHSELAICVARDNEKLQSQMNEAIMHLQKEGVIDTIVNRHLERHIATAYHSNSSKKNGTLRFATNATFEPFEYYDEGKIVGIDVDVARAIADKMGMEMEMTDMEFDAIIASVQTGKVDAGIAGLTVTPEREKNIRFTSPYFTKLRQVVIVNTDTHAHSKNITETFTNCFIEGHRYQYLLKGLGNTLTITFFAIMLSLALGTMIAIVRSTHDRNGNHKTLNIFCQMYLTVFRGTPTMVQLLIIYYVVFASVNVDKIFVASIAFGLNSAAYIAEVIRSGIMSVDIGQIEAGRSLGLSHSKTMRLVILPQAFKNALPSIGNELITMLKETSISGYIGLVDLTKGSDIIRSVTYEAMMPLGVVALIYLTIVLGLAYIVHLIEMRLRKNER